jgi:hypothetical protein
MFWILMYLTAVLIASVGAFRWGGKPERVGAASIIAAALGTQAVVLASHGAGSPYAVMAIDTVLLVALFGLALRSDRFWPMWVAAFHLVSMTVHLAKLVDPSVAWLPYLHANAFWAYPMLVALTIGAWVEGPNGRRRLVG